MYNVRTISNITCIEELRQIINSNLITDIRYDFNCKKCVEIKNELIDMNNYNISNFDFGLRIYNNELIKKYGLFVNIIYTYYRIKNNGNFKRISEKSFFDSIRVGSLLQIYESETYVINKIKKKFHEVNFIQTVDNFHYYLVERPTLTKPARKNNLNN